MRISKRLLKSLSAICTIKQHNRIELQYFLGWIHGKRALKTFGLELLDEYEFPQPMPEDKFYDYHVDTNQAYLMLATGGTGTLNILPGIFLGY